MKHSTLTIVASLVGATFMLLPAAATSHPKREKQMEEARVSPPRDKEADERAISNFLAVSMSAEFKNAEAHHDIKTAQSLLLAKGIFPNPEFQQGVFDALCLPPKHWVNVLALILGPHPMPDDPVGWYWGWMPKCEPGPILVKIPSSWSSGH